MKKLIVLAAILCSAGGAFAGTQTANLSVSMTVVNNCTISTGAVAFGNYDIITNASAALNGSGSLTVTCTTGGAYTLTLGQGSNAALGSTDAVPLRRMISGLNHASYGLYQDSGRSTLWGNTSLTGVAGTGSGAAQVITVYGQAISAQNIPAGSYADTVLATVSF